MNPLFVNIIDATLVITYIKVATLSDNRLKVINAISITIINIITL